MRALDRQLEVSRDTAQNYANTQRIFDLRYKGGVVSKLELAQVQSQYQQALAAIPALEQQIAAQENLIAVLQGRNPYSIPRGKTIAQLVPPGVPGALPSALLERRPDILQAEQNLVAANANIGAAKALYFPQISLTGSFGSVSAALGNFLSGPATAWLIAAGLTGPIFTAGSIAGQVATAEANTAGSLAEYQQTILNAFRETNDALVGNRQEEAGVGCADPAGSHRCANMRACRVCASTMGTLATWKCSTPKMNCLPRSSPTCARLRTALRRSSTCTRRWAAAGVDLADQSTAAGRDPPLAERAAKQPMF